MKGGVRLRWFLAGAGAVVLLTVAVVALASLAVHLIKPASAARTAEVEESVRSMQRRKGTVRSVDCKSTAHDAWTCDVHFKGWRETLHATMSEGRERTINLERVP